MEGLITAVKRYSFLASSMALASFSFLASSSLSSRLVFSLAEAGMVMRSAKAVKMVMNAFMGGVELG